MEGRGAEGSNLRGEGSLGERLWGRECETNIRILTIWKSIIIFTPDTSFSLFSEKTYSIPVVLYL